MLKDSGEEGSLLWVMNAMPALCTIFDENNMFMEIFYKGFFSDLLNLIKDADENVEEQKSTARGISNLVLILLEFQLEESNFEQNILEYMNGM